MNQIGMTSTIRIHTQPSTNVRTTVDNSFGAKLQQGLSATANAVGGAASMAVANIPGGTVVSAALAGAQNMGSSSQALSAAPGSVAPVGSAPTASGVSSAGSSGINAQSPMGEMGKFMEMQQSFNMENLKLQPICSRNRVASRRFPM